MNSEKYCHKSIGTGNAFQQHWHWYRQYFFAKVPILTWTTVFTSIVNIHAGNTDALAPPQPTKLIIHISV